MNNGKGIPIEVHKEHNVHIPSMIFGEMMTSSNYDDNEKKVTGGRNGFGAKLCNIFSESFTGTDNRLGIRLWVNTILALSKSKSPNDYFEIKLKPPLVERSSNRHGLEIWNRKSHQRSIHIPKMILQGSHFDLIWLDSKSMQCQTIWYHYSENELTILLVPLLD